MRYPALSFPGPVLTRRDIEDKLYRCRGLIPIDIDLTLDQLIWADLGQYHCYRGFFHQAFAEWAVIRGGPPDCLASPCDVLEELQLPADCSSPSGFIFHAGRCGSTLLAEVLARSRRNLVFIEAAPHNRIWRRGGTTLPVYRNLVCVMGRRRLTSYRSHIIKFTSYNILKFNQIRNAFPGVPALFLFRDPGAALDSYHRGLPAWMTRDPAMEQLPATPEAAMERFYRAALAIEDPLFWTLDYSRIRPEIIPSVLSCFGLDADEHSLARMLSVFEWEAKDARMRRRLTPVPGSSRKPSPTLESLYSRLRLWHMLPEIPLNNNLRQE